MFRKRLTRRLVVERALIEVDKETWIALVLLFCAGGGLVRLEDLLFFFVSFPVNRNLGARFAPP